MPSRAPVAVLAADQPSGWFEPRARSFAAVAEWVTAHWGAVRARLARAAADAAAGQYSWDSIAQRTLSLYRALLDGRAD